MTRFPLFFWLCTSVKVHRLYLASRVSLDSYLLSGFQSELMQASVDSHTIPGYNGVTIRIFFMDRYVSYGSQDLSDYAGLYILALVLSFSVAMHFFSDSQC